ncbi:general receptor for phosphoinositides 1-associated scaffold protein isoform X1 [Poecilia formosa]|uniref:Trafficking regulator and scaffold protein tamalin n=1 Tax=Poecilia formosa TaxID=48698 RepID=A0A087XTY5_POEFO|nr:PREDICTED: general receptor for phosphoinositides 1-associated scaffold protein isoform X1 [Poecilia formosa]XP_007553674.1 PREDICTED: general receptor for phosphoinositides 1-associated scaffold protein isoform X1 [Poecilia formosa]
MTFRRLKKVNSSGVDGGSASQDNDIYFPSSKSDSCRTVDLPANSSEVYNYKTLAYSGGTLPRNFKKGGGSQKWKPLTLPPEPQRKVVNLEKNEEEAFGFEIQTYGLHHQEPNSVEMCTFVCRVHDGSPAQLAGLKVGDTIASVNETAVEGFLHKDIVQLIRSCGNTLRLETVYSDSIRKAELEARLQYLKQTLHEKWDEYRSLMVQEQRLVHGIVMSDAALYESLESAGIYGSLGAPSPAAQRALHCNGSTSSSASLLSTATEDDPLYQTCQYHSDSYMDSSSADKLNEQPPSQRQQRIRPTSELLTVTKTHLTRSASTRSYVRGSSSSSSSVGSAEKQGGFGSLQRKPKQKSFRRRLLKFIPGLNRPLEEEESKL